MRFTRILRAAFGAAAMFWLVSPAAAQTPEIRLARQFSMGYLQLNVMEHQQLIEKHAKALGIPVWTFRPAGPFAPAGDFPTYTPCNSDRLSAQGR